MVFGCSSFTLDSQTTQSSLDSLNSAASFCLSDCLSVRQHQVDKAARANARVLKQYQQQIQKLDAHVEAERARAKVLPIDEHALDELRKQLAHAQEIQVRMRMGCPGMLFAHCQSEFTLLLIANFNLIVTTYST